MRGMKIVLFLVDSFIIFGLAWLIKLFLLQNLLIPAFLTGGFGIWWAIVKLKQSLFMLLDDFFPKKTTSDEE